MLIGEIFDGKKRGQDILGKSCHLRVYPLLTHLLTGTLGTNLQVWVIRARDRPKVWLGERDTQGTWWEVELSPFLCCMFPLTIEGSWAHLLPWGPVDLVVSNPPYVFHQDMEQLAPEIRRCRV